MSVPGEPLFSVAECWHEKECWREKRTRRVTPRPLCSICSALARGNLRGWLFVNERKRTMVCEPESELAAVLSSAIRWERLLLVWSVAMTAI